MSRKEVSMIGESDPGHDEGCDGDILKEADPDGRVPGKIRWNRPGDVRVTIFMNWFPQRNL